MWKGREELQWKSAFPLGELVDEARGEGSHAAGEDDVKDPEATRELSPRTGRNLGWDLSAPGCSVPCDPL